jgi:hypothetical protein
MSAFNQRWKWNQDNMLPYQKQMWSDLPSETTPLSAERLLHIENGIGDASDAFLDQATKVDGIPTTVQNILDTKGVVYNNDTRLFALTDVAGYRLIIKDALTGRAVLAVNDAGDTFFRFSKDVKTPFNLPEDNLETIDLTHEWWTGPFITAIGATLYGSGVSSIGEIWYYEKNKREKAKFTFMGMSKVDDHCAPSLYVKEGRAKLITWNWHGDTNGLQYRVQLPNGTWLPEQFMSIGLSASYDQMELVDHLSDAAQDTHYHLIRRGATAWCIQRTSLDQATGTLTKVGTQINLTTSSPYQSYISKRSLTINGQQHWDIFWYNNPKEATSEVHAFRINLVTGAVTSPVETGFSANLDGTNLPLVKSARTPIFAALPSPLDRRMFYPSPLDEWALLVAEWNTTNPAAGRYIEQKWVNGTVTSTDLGRTGVKVGYTVDGNYVGGANYSPDGTKIVWTELMEDGTSRVYLKTKATGVTVEIARYPHFVIRPMWVGNFQIIVGHVHWYGADYYDFKITDRSIFLSQRVTA